MSRYSRNLEPTLTYNVVIYDEQKNERELKVSACSKQDVVNTIATMGHEWDILSIEEEPCSLPTAPDCH